MLWMALDLESYGMAGRRDLRVHSCSAPWRLPQQRKQRGRALQRAPAGQVVPGELRAGEHIARQPQHAHASGLIRPRAAQRRHHTGGQRRHCKPAPNYRTCSGVSPVFVANPYIPSLACSRSLAWLHSRCPKSGGAMTAVGRQCCDCTQALAVKHWLQRKHCMASPLLHLYWCMTSPHYGLTITDRQRRGKNSLTNLLRHHTCP